MSSTHHLLHTLFHTMLRLTGIKLRFKNLNTVLMYIKNEQRKPVLEFDSLTSLKLKSKLSKSMFNEMPVYHINDKSSHDTLIIYLHGGAFINQPLAQHFSLVDNIAQLTDSTIIFPCYPRLPDSNEDHCLSVLENYLSKLIEDKPNNRLILMGDSAGGWLALSLAKYLRDEHHSSADHLILFSPWCDLSMSVVDENLEKKDPILSHEGLRQIGIMWVNNTFESNKHGFRINDTLKDLGDIHVYVGSHEIFLSQTQALKESATSQGVNLNLKEFKMMIHDFILFPFKESKEVNHEIVETINQK